LKTYNTNKLHKGDNETIFTLVIQCQYLAQLEEIADEPAFKVRFFPLSLSRPAFLWFASLPHNSIEGWEDLKTKFHHYFD